LRLNIGRIAGYVTEVAYKEVGEGHEQDVEALQRTQRKVKSLEELSRFLFFVQVILTGYLLRIA